MWNVEEDAWQLASSEAVEQGIEEKHRNEAVEQDIGAKHSMQEQYLVEGRASGVFLTSDWERARPGVWTLR